MLERRSVLWKALTSWKFGAEMRKRRNLQMITKDVSTSAIGLMFVLGLGAAASSAQAATFSGGEAEALKANALGISLALSDTGPLPASGGNLSTSVASVNVLGLASAETLRSTASGSGSSTQSQSEVQNLNLLNGLIAADVVKSDSSASCSGSTAAASGNSELVGLVVAGRSVLVSSPNLAISLPGGISVVVNEQTSSQGGSAGAMTVNALHVKGPSIDIVVASAHSDITCP
jgi:hypothetical protein